MGLMVVMVKSHTACLYHGLVSLFLGVISIGKRGYPGRKSMIGNILLSSQPTSILDMLVKVGRKIDPT